MAQTKRAKTTKAKVSKNNLIKKKIGLLLSDEDDWPVAIEALAKRFLKPLKKGSSQLGIELERIRIHPFSLRDKTSYDLVIDRLAWWHVNPREWLKKAAIINNVYLLNNPFTFQSMEKHTAYCAMIRMGLHIPETILLPPKQGPATEKFRRTAERYHDMFDLRAIGDKMGYPIYMKPFDGGGWRGVTRVDNADELMRAYDDSGSTVMHIQKGIDNFDVFVRSLGIGPQVISLKYDPSQPMHGRYQIEHDFLSAKKGEEARMITKIINAVFRWDFNSCEAILKNGKLQPMDFANACPDIALTSLHYYFPWAIKSLLAWSLYALVSERKVHITMDLDPYFKIADSDMSYWDKLVAYEALADRHFETDKFNAFKEKQLKGLDEAMWDYVGSQDFDDLLVSLVRGQFPAHEHEQYIAHFRGIMRHWHEAEAAGA
ncbi:MAG: hypothetical protein KC422_21545 [Trueperaceae bacterium]|nr:hypothetical protein [Trueperaceae bacterium]